MRTFTALPLAVALLLTMSGCGSSGSGSAGAAETMIGTSDSTRAETSVSPMATAMASPSMTPDSGVLVADDEEVDAYCGPFKGDPMFFSDSEDGVEDVTTFGEVWDRLNKGQYCDTSSEEDFMFAWTYGEDDENGENTTVPEPKYQPAIEKAFGKKIPEDWGTPAELLREALGQCVARTDDPMSEVSNPLAVRRFSLSLQLCPEHPQSKQWKELAKHLDSAEAASAKADKERAAAAAKEQANVANHYVARDGGHYLIGKTLTPGLYRTDLNMVTNCYWELSDAEGNIIDNNFISTAPQFDLYIPATASGFTISGCSMTRIGD